MDKGSIAFYIGLIIAIIAGFANIGSVGFQALVVLGVIVGILNVTGEEVQHFLLGTVALLLAGAALWNIDWGAVTFVKNVIGAFTAFVAGAALIVGLKIVWTVTKSK
ncbi:MAG: hypothetical protein HY518_04200 [Candidatus Aenigmarchaeota archaeon]|nr:hypothetical protein [Candidatus Aenigmarchaeota archaeon]